MNLEEYRAFMKWAREYEVQNLCITGPKRSNEYDFSVLKVVIDMFDSAEKEKQILREKYKELRSIINEIYNN